MESDLTAPIQSLEKSNDEYEADFLNISVEAQVTSPSPAIPHENPLFPNPITTSTNTVQARHSPAEHASGLSAQNSHNVHAPEDFEAKSKFPSSHMSVSRADESKHNERDGITNKELKGYNDMEIDQRFIMKVFKDLDTDQNGKISLVELRASLKSHENPDIVRLQKVLGLPDHKVKPQGMIN